MKNLFHLFLNIKGRKWINSYDKLNMTDGEVYTSPMEDSVNGKISFDFHPIFQSREVKDIKLTFKDSMCIESKAGKGKVGTSGMIIDILGSFKYLFYSIILLSILGMLITKRYINK